MNIPKSSPPNVTVNDPQPPPPVSMSTAKGQAIALAMPKFSSKRGSDQLTLKQFLMHFEWSYHQHFQIAAENDLWQSVKFVLLSVLKGSAFDAVNDARTGDY